MSKSANSSDASTEHPVGPEGLVKSGPCHETLANRICDAGVASFAVWTLLTNCATWLAFGLDALIALAAATAALIIAVAWWRRGSHRQPAASAETVDRPDADRGLAPRWQLAALVVALAALGLRAATGSLTVYWLIALGAAGGAAATSVAVRPRWTQPREVRGAGGWLLAMALLCALATAVAHRGDADDAFYVNLAVAAVDHPDAPLLANDTLHGVDGIPMSMPVFRVLSIEMLEAAIARLSGWSALDVAHLMIPPIFAFLMVLAYARLLRLLLPRRWLWALGCLLAFLFFVGDGELGYGDFAFLRMQQGKSMLLHVALPLLTSYALEFGLAPTRRRWLRLAGAQICAVGLSSTALWLAPAAAGLALASAVPISAAGGSRRGWHTLALGVTASLHPLGLALCLRGETERVFREAVHRMETLSWSGERLLQWSLDSVLGSGIGEMLALFALIAVLGTATSTLFLRFSAVFTTAVLLLFWNPWTAPLVAAHVTGPDTYFRVFWLLPLPVFVAAVLTAPLEIGAGRWRVPRWLRIASILFSSVALLVFGPEVHTLSRANHVRIARPGWKIPPLPFDAARQLSRYARQGERVLAPRSVSRWIPLIQRHPYPLVIREIHLDLLHERLGAEEIRRRALLTRLVGGEVRRSDAGALLAEAIEGYPLSAVCLGGPAMGWPELRRVLLDSALEVRHRSSDYEVWARRGPQEDSSR